MDTRLWIWYDWFIDFLFVVLWAWLWSIGITDGESPVKRVMVTLRASVLTLVWTSQLLLFVVLIFMWQIVCGINTDGCVLIIIYVENVTYFECESSLYFSLDMKYAFWDKWIEILNFVYKIWLRQTTNSKLICYICKTPRFCYWRWLFWKVLKTNTLLQIFLWNLHICTQFELVLQLSTWTLL